MSIDGNLHGVNSWTCQILECVELLAINSYILLISAWFYNKTEFPRQTNTQNLVVIIKTYGNGKMCTMSKGGQTTARGQQSAGQDILKCPLKCFEN